MDLPWVEKYLLNHCCKSFHAMGNVKESYHSLAKWSRVCLKCAGLLTGSILYVSIQSLALNKLASGLSPGRPLKIGGDIFTLGGWGAGPPGPGAGNPAVAACIAATSCANKAAPAGGEPGGPGGPAGPAGPGTGGGGGGRGTAPPLAPPAPPAPPLGGGIGAAISKAQCSNKLNPTLLIDSRSL